MSLRIVPYQSHASHTTPLLSAPSAPGVHDTLRASLNEAWPAPTGTSTASSSSNNAPLQSNHPLEARLNNWRATQDGMQMNMLRRQFGIAEPVRRGMEMRIVGMGEWRPSCLSVMGLGNVHSDVLAGRDCEIGWEDVFGGGREFQELPGFHTEMEHRLNMNW